MYWFLKARCSNLEDGKTTYTHFCVVNEVSKKQWLRLGEFKHQESRISGIKFKQNLKNPSWAHLFLMLPISALSGNSPSWCQWWHWQSWGIWSSQPAWWWGGRWCWPSSAAPHLSQSGRPGSLPPPPAPPAVCPYCTFEPSMAESAQINKKEFLVQLHW